MANMLIRTKQCKARLAVVIRVVLFFGIPSFYFVFLRGHVTETYSISSRHNYESGTSVMLNIEYNVKLSTYLLNSCCL